MLLTEIKNILDKIQKNVTGAEDIRLAFQTGFEKTLVVRASCVHNDQFYMIEHVCTEENISNNEKHTIRFIKDIIIAKMTDEVEG